MKRNYIEQPIRTLTHLKDQPFTRAEDLVLHGFLLKVDKNGPNGCWDWVGSIGMNGYGRFSFLSKTWLPHRVSWLLHKGPIPKGKFLCHKCDRPVCVNPEHLFLGTPHHNTMDMVRKGRFVSNLYMRTAKQRKAFRKLTDDQVREIRTLLSNTTNVKISKTYNVTPECISHIRCGKTFKDVL